MPLAVMLSFALAQMLSVFPASDSLPSSVPALEASGQYADAARVLEEAAARDPAVADALLCRAMVFRAVLGDLEAVGADLATLRREGASAARVAGVLLDTLGEFGAAAAPAARVHLLHRCLRREGWCATPADRVRALLLLGEAQRAVGDLEAAEHAYQAADALAASGSDRVRAREGLLAVRHPRFVARRRPVFNGEGRVAFDRWVVRVWHPWVRRQMREGEELEVMFYPRAVGSFAGERPLPRVESIARLAEVRERACLAATEQLIPPDIEATPVLREAWLGRYSEDPERGWTRSRRCGNPWYARCEFMAVQHREPGVWLRGCADRRAQLEGPLAPTHDELLPLLQAGPRTFWATHTDPASP